VRGILVIDEGGIVQFTAGFDKLQDNTQLFGSFLSAIQLYGRAMSGNDVNELTFAEIRLLSGMANGYQVVTIHYIEDEDADWNHSTVISIVEDMEYKLDDQFLASLRQLLKRGPITTDEVIIGIDELLKPTSK
jgi:hypothetical protein